MKIWNSLPYKLAHTFTASPGRSFRSGLGALALGLLSVQSPAALAHCSWSHIHHCPVSLVNEVADAASYIGEKKIGGTSLGAKTVLNMA